MPNASVMSDKGVELLVYATLTPQPDPSVTLRIQDQNRGIGTTLVISPSLALRLAGELELLAMALLTDPD